MLSLRWPPPEGPVRQLWPDECSVQEVAWFLQLSGVDPRAPQSGFQGGDAGIDFGGILPPPRTPPPPPPLHSPPGGWVGLGHGLHWRRVPTASVSFAPQHDWVPPRLSGLTTPQTADGP